VYVFVATMLLGYVLLAILGLLQLAKDLLARPFSPVPSNAETEEDQEDDLAETNDPTRSALDARDQRGFS
jgi:hypothetical protein